MKVDLYKTFKIWVPQTGSLTDWMNHARESALLLKEYHEEGDDHTIGEARITNAEQARDEAEYLSEIVRQLYVNLVDMDTEDLLHSWSGSPKSVNVEEDVPF